MPTAYRVKEGIGSNVFVYAPPVAYALCRRTTQPCINEVIYYIGQDWWTVGGDRCKVLNSNFIIKNFLTAI